MIEQVTLFVTLLSVYAIAVTTVLILRSGLSTYQVTILTLFVLSLICYLLVGQTVNTDFFYPLLSGTVLLPYSFWRMSKALFSDKQYGLKRIGIEVVLVVAYYHALGALQYSDSLSDAGVIIMKLTSISFLILSIIESQRGKKDDLVKSRIRLRKTFIYFVAITGLITILTETSIASTEMLTLKMIQRISIFLFSTYFLVVNTQWQEQFFGKKVKPLKILHQGLIDQIHHLMQHEQFYKQEGLTIGQLAEKLNEQEYKLRSVINQEMGFRNFPAFVNTFRIEEAKQLLLVKGKQALTIQEIAFQTGFNSIGPFNRAFKTKTDLTPKAFREQNETES